METSHYVQLSIGLILGVGLLAASYVVNERKIMWVLLLLIPFQPIVSRYGSANELFVYLVGFALLLRWKTKLFPLSGYILFLILVYFLSLAMAPRWTYTSHLFYLVAIGSNFVLFYLVYNFVMRQNAWQEIWKIVVAINILVLGYCSLQLVVGFGDLSLFGLSELSIETSREAHHRLTGPFRVTAMTAEYLVIQIMMLMYAYIRETNSRRKILWLVMAVANFGFIVATGNRGGVVSLVIGALAFFFLFRKELGATRIVLISVVGVILLGAVSVVMVRYTEFDSMFDRFTETKFDGYIPDTRSVWSEVWPRIIEAPVLGHGPRFRVEQPEGTVQRSASVAYPHNLYMYIFYTIGGVGLSAYLVLFFNIGLRYFKASRIVTGDRVLDGIPRVGIVVLLVFVTSEMRMEMLRFLLNDYQQYLFMILAGFMALSDIKRKKTKAIDEHDSLSVKGKRILSMRQG